MSLTVRVHAPRPAQLVGLFTTLVLALALMLASPLKASAHIPAVASQCGSLSVNLQNYRTSYEHYNSLVTTVDGAVVDNVHFGASYTQIYTLTKYADHSYTVQVTAWDDPNGSKGWTKTYAGTIKACEQPPKTLVSGSVTFTEGTVKCVDQSVVYTNPTYTVAGDTHVVYDTSRGVHQANFGQTVIVKATGVDDSSKTLSGPTAWSHTFATQATPPPNCVPAHHLWPTASVNASCSCKATLVLNNQASNVGYTFPVSFVKTVHGHAKHIMRNVHVKAGNMKVLHLKHLKHYSQVRVGFSGSLLAQGKVPGPCITHIPDTGKRVIA